MFKNAGIKSREEALTRLIAGEEFYYKNDGRITFDIEHIYVDSPFRVTSDALNISAPLSRSIDYYADWLLKDIWYENLDWDKPVLCWVHQLDPTKRVIAVYISQIDRSSDTIFVEERLTPHTCRLKRVYHKYATPVTAKDI